MARKRFSKSLFKQNDEVAKKAATKYYENIGYEVRLNDNKYGPDLLLFKENNFASYVECEVKRVWKDYEFPFPNIQFPERKSKYITDKPILFFMLNGKENRALIVKGTDLIISPLKEVSNKYVRHGESFFQVPLIKAVFVDLK